MYKANENVLKTPVADNGILLLEPKAGLYFELNESSVLIYQGIINGLPKSEILTQILDVYDISKQQANEDIDGLIEQLLKNEIIKLD